MNARKHIRRNAEQTPKPTFVFDESHSLEQTLIPDNGVSDLPYFGHDFSRIQIHAVMPETLQTKLLISRPEDSYEQEAEYVAEQVTKMDVSGPGTSAVYDEKREKLSPMHKGSALQSTEETREVSPIVHEVLNDSGQPLDASTQAFMEPRFGHDFSRVRIHNDEKAAATAQAVNAQAYTVGGDIVFGEARYMPDTTDGKNLLAHELVHVVQQEHDPVPYIQRREGQATGTQATLQQDAGTSQQDAGALGTPQATGSEPPELTAKLDQITQRYRDMISEARKQGKNVAADNLERFLAGTGGVATLSVAWLRGFSEVTDAEQVNQERFERSLTDRGKHLKHGDKDSFSDHWDRLITAGVTTELYYASGTSTLTSSGDFTLTCIEDTVSISGTVRHHWHDPYDWHAGLSANIPGFGNVSDADALLLQTYRGAKPFDMVAEWQQIVNGTIILRTWWFDSVSYNWTGP